MVIIISVPSSETAWYFWFRNTMKPKDGHLSRICLFMAPILVSSRLLMEYLCAQPSMTHISRLQRSQSWGTVTRSGDCAAPGTLCSHPSHEKVMVRKSLEIAPVFRLHKWNTQFRVCFQNLLDFLWGFLIHLLPFGQGLVCLCWGEVVIPLPLGFEAQLVPIVLDV